MAIIIPSKNLYNKDNSKVRDNVIERVEVDIKKVYPKNEYKVSVYDGSFAVDYIEVKENSLLKYIDGIDLNAGGDTTTNLRVASELNYKLKYFTTPDIYIPKVKVNKYISKVYDGVDENGEKEIKVQVSFFQNTYIGTNSYSPKENKFFYDNYVEVEPNKMETHQYNGFEYIRDISDNLSYQPEDIETITAKHSIKDENGKINLNAYFYGDSRFNWSPDPIEIFISEETPIQDTEIFAEEVVVDGVEYYKLSKTKLLVGLEAEFATTFFKSKKEIASLSGYAPATTTKIIQTFQELTITVYGNTIGIDFSDNIAKIGNGPSKKVHSIERNELMQTQNYYEGIIDYPINVRFIRKLGTQSNYVVLDLGINKDFSIGDQFIYNGEQASILGFSNEGYEVAVVEFGEIYNALITNGQKEITAFYQESGKISMIEGNFAKTIEEYKNGKETATIRCSISDYYDENGDKVISDNNSTGKMAFDFYDKVIPMVYGANGKDRPMSLYKDGTPKVFQVLGKKVFYDGAVWQELTLQEI